MSDAARILVVEDEAPLRTGLVQALEGAGHRVTAVETVAAATDALAGQPDLVILDRRLPDGEGLEVLRAVRAQAAPTAVIVLSARGMPDDRIEGLEGGADDYVTKPFHLRELLARVERVLARVAAEGPGDAAHVTGGPFALDVGARQVTAHGAPVALTRLEFDLLHYLLRHPGRALSRTELLDRVWGYEHYPTTRTVDYHMLSLRKKLGESSPPRHLVTVQGVGYRFMP